jgi:hypothetical protein
MYFVSRQFQERATWLCELTSRALLTHQLHGLLLSYQVRRTTASFNMTVKAPADAQTDAQALFSSPFPS